MSEKGEKEKEEKACPSPHRLHLKAAWNTHSHAHSASKWNKVGSCSVCLRKYLPVTTATIGKRRDWIQRDLSRAQKRPTTGKRVQVALPLRTGTRGSSQMVRATSVPHRLGMHHSFRLTKWPRVASNPRAEGKTMGVRHLHWAVPSGTDSENNY